MISEFEKKWSKWISSYRKIRRGYNKDLWGRIDQHPLDKTIDILAQFYGISSEEHKNVIESALSNQKIEPWDLALYIRRVGLRLPNEKDGKLILCAIWIFRLSIDYIDPRDLIVSLTLLWIGIQKANMGIEDTLYKAELIKKPMALKLFESVLVQSKEDVDSVVKVFGPPLWKQ